MSLATLALCLVGAYRVDSTVVVPIDELRRAVVMLVDDSLCRIQTAVQDSIIHTYEQATADLKEENRMQGRALDLTTVALDASDRGRKALVDDASRLTTLADRWRYVAIAEGVVFVLLTLLYK